MSERQVALLRGINVGTAKRVAMADLRAMIEQLGYRDVTTLLNSGNAVFTSADAPLKAAARIEAALAAQLGVSSRVTVLTAAEVAAAVKKNPLEKVADNPSLLLVTVLNDPADRKHLMPLTKQDWAPEAFALGARVAYVWCANGSIKSQLWKAVERTLGKGVTSRNWATMMKIHALASEQP